MQLSENQIFDGRYLLVELIGRGASAEVWKAVDTKANNMPVAVKIYKPDSIGPGSAGIAEFQREFTMVYNMTHTNLLHPQGFDIVEGAPYLVMAFCENGSATSMVGRCNEDDLLRFLRDVAAGLEYLHDHNITHQDIKPDNVLVDDNCNFMVTDFGISRREAANDAIGGTRAYMAPEVYRRKPEHASDIWSLGATAIELLDGQPPYGELGGAGQLQNPGQPVIRAKLSEPVKKLITEMLDPDPRKRPSAAAIRSRIEHFRETGSWNRNVQRNKIAYIAAGIASLLLCAGLFVWDINRTKIRYYKDYTEIWGVPHGIGHVSAYDQRHRAYTYKMEYRGGKLRHISRVNQMGNIVMPGETELQKKLTEAAYFYTNDGQVDYVKIYDIGGQCEYVADYDGNMRTLIFKSDDEYGTEKPLPGKTTETALALTDIEVGQSTITRYKLTYDDKGRIIKQVYATFQNVDVCDDDMIHGIAFEYDDRNRIIKRTNLGMDETPQGNSRGLAVKEYEYDDDDNWITLRYLTVDGSPSSDGTNIPVLKHEYDGYGNIVSENYFDLEGNPMLRADINIAGTQYELNEIGQVVKTTFLGLDGKPSYIPNGHMAVKYDYDDNGYVLRTSLLDERDSLVNSLDDPDPAKTTVCYSILEQKNNNRGIASEFAYFDKFHKPIQNKQGFHAIKCILDSVGNPTQINFIGKDGKPVGNDGFQARMDRKYDEYGRLVEESYFDTEGKAINVAEGYSIIRFEYDRAGRQVKNAVFGTDGKPVLSNDRYSSITCEYDQKGNLISQKVFDTNSKPINCMAGWQYNKYVYDPTTNYKTAVYYYDTAGKQVMGEEYKYDNRGNVIESRELAGAGQLKSGTVVRHYMYDENNRPTKIWFTNLSGNKVNFPEDTYNEVRYKYDQNGNDIERTFWSASGQPVLCAAKVHKIVQEYNNRNQRIHWLNLDTNGNAIKSSMENPPEARFEYDARGNNTAIIIFDGKGMPHNSLKGWQKQLDTFDDRNNVIETRFFDKDGKPVNDKEKGCSRIVYTYNDHGNLTKEEHYDTTKLILVQSFKYNKRDQPTEYITRDGNGKVPDGYFARMVIEYEPDDITYRKLSCYDASGKLQAYMTWNKAKRAWNDPQFPGQSMSYSSPVASSGGNWQDEFRALARQCPMTIDENVDIQSVSVGSSSVTITYKLKQVSKYEMNSEQRAAAREVMSGMRDMFAGVLPSYVSLHVILLDKAGRTIDL